MNEREYISLRLRLSRDINNLKNALQMYGELMGGINSDALDEVAEAEGELVKKLCGKVTADIDGLFCSNK